jgi:hypothetical protein
MRNLRLPAAAAVAAAAILLSAGTALADGPRGGDDQGLTCAGGPIASATYQSLTVAGVCTIPSGSVTVRGNLFIRPGALLDAATPSSLPTPGLPGSLAVGGSIFVGHGAVLYLGCGRSLPFCGSSSTLGKDTVGGSIIAVDALGVVIHAVTVGHDLSIIGGGGGPTIADVSQPGACFGIPAPAPWSQDPTLAGTPVYGDVEDSTIGGDMRMIGIQSCWLGALRNTVRGNVLDLRNQMGDPDANEVLNNLVGRDLVCFDNSPGVHVGDSNQPPNTVGGRALGECASPLISTVVQRSQGGDD